MKYFDSKEFKCILRRYEAKQREGSICYFDSDDYMDISDYYLSDGKPKKALKAVKQGLQLHPDDDVLKSVMAGVLIYLRQFDEAAALVNQLRVEDNSDVLYLQAQLAYAVENDIPRADILFEAWVNSTMPDTFDDEDEDEPEYEDDNPQNQARDAYIHVIMSIVELAPCPNQQMLKKWVHRYVDTFSPLGQYDADLALADIVRDENLAEECVLVFTQLLDDNPYIQGGWTVLAAAQHMLGDTNECLNSLEFALAINPDDTDALTLKGHCLYTLQRWQDALDIFQKCHPLVADSRSLEQSIAYCLINMNQREAAIPHLDIAAKYIEQQDLEPEEKSWSMFDIAEPYYVCGCYAKAMELLDRAMKVDSNVYPEFLMLKGALLLATNRFEEAIKCYAIVMDITKFSPAFVVEMAAAFLTYGYTETAEKVLTKAVAIPDDVPFPNRSYGYAYMALAKFNLQKYAECVTWLKKAWDTNPDAVGTVLHDVIPEGMTPTEFYEHLIANRKTE